MQKDLIKASNKIERASVLKQQLKDLDYFIHVLDVDVNIPKHTKCLLTRSVERVKSISYKFFGTREHGLGTIKQEIKVPACMIYDLVVLAKKQRELLMIELNLIIS